jgi:hypothetical protein
MMAIGDSVQVDNVAVEAPVNVSISSQGSLVDSVVNFVNGSIDKIRRADDEAMTILFMGVMLGLTFRILWRSVE